MELHRLQRNAIFEMKEKHPKDDDDMDVDDDKDDDVEDDSDGVEIESDYE